MCFSFTKIKVFFRPYLGCGAESASQTLSKQTSSLSDLTTKRTNYDFIRDVLIDEPKVLNCLVHYQTK